jgi:hypothetical protein
MDIENKNEFDMILALKKIVLFVRRAHLRIYIFLDLASGAYSGILVSIPANLNLTAAYLNRQTSPAHWPTTFYFSSHCSQSIPSFYPDPEVSLWWAPTWPCGCDAPGRSAVIASHPHWEAL